MGFWFYRLEDFGEAGYEFFAVRLVDGVLHGRVDEVGVGWGLAEGMSEDGDALHVEDLVMRRGKLVFG